MRCKPGLVRLVIALIGTGYGVAAVAGVPVLRTVEVAAGFTQPLFATSPPADPSRLFVLEKEGVIRIIQGGEVLESPFLDLTSIVNSDGGEQGLLGLAFHPNYAENGFFYLNFTIGAGFLQQDKTVVARFRVSENPNAADPDSQVTLLEFNQPLSNHNGGMMAFGPNDGYLYIASGDGGGANDTFNNGQDLETFLGKMLRIDVDSGNPFAIPPDNPFVDDPDAFNSIWAYGLRNPWRCSFDREPGDLYIADVGQDAREEINRQPASSMGGENYGWRIAEGFACRGGEGSCGTNEGFTPPIFDYSHDVGRSVTGGYVYRGDNIPGLEGTYFFADFVTSRIWSFRPDMNGGVTEFTEWTPELSPEDRNFQGIASFGEDASGELYIVDFGGGRIYKIVGEEVFGDIDGDGLVNSVDVQLAINGALGLDTGTNNPDVNGDNTVNAVDVQSVINAALGLT